MHSISTSPLDSSMPNAKPPPPQERRIYLCFHPLTQPSAEIRRQLPRIGNFLLALQNKVRERPAPPRSNRSTLPPTPQPGTLRSSASLLIALDMDGTLLGDDGRVSPRNLAALQSAVP